MRSRKAIDAVPVPTIMFKGTQFTFPLFLTAANTRTVFLGMLALHRVSTINDWLQQLSECDSLVGEM